MTDRKRKQSQRRPTSSYRAPSRGETEPRRGLLDRFAPRPPGTSPMPRIRTSFARGLTVVLATPLLVGGIPVVVFLGWIALVALGFQGPFALLGAVFAVPPISTYLDLSLASMVFSQAGRSGVGVALAPFIAIAGFLSISAAFQALVTTATVERLRTGSVTSWAVRRALHVLPVTIGVGVANLGVLIGAQFGQLLGAGIGLLIAVGILIAGVYLLAFAPAIAADEDHPLPVTMSKAVRAARMPGSNNLLLAALYVIPSLALFSATSLGALPGSTIDVNPSIGAWVTVILVNVLQMAMVATFAFRYLAVADAVPEPTPAPARTRR
jgi:hypothetical protein